MVLSLQSVRHASGRRITQDGRQILTGQECAQGCFRMASEKFAEILTRSTRFKIVAQEALDRIRYFIGRATKTHRPPESGVLTHRAPEAEIVGILDAAI